MYSDFIFREYLRGIVILNYWYFSAIKIEEIYVSTGAQQVNIQEALVTSRHHAKCWSWCNQEGRSILSGIKFAACKEVS
jgi:hypothetical protein